MADISMWDRDTRACERCGLERKTKGGRTIPAMCRDCRWITDSAVETPEPLTGGQYVRDGLIWRYELYTCPCGEPIDNPLGTCRRCVTWAERDAVRASWKRPRTDEEAA